MKPISVRKCLKALKRAGFQVDRQSGSHIILIHANGSMVVVPQHTKDIPVGTLKSIIKQAGLTEDEELIQAFAART